MEYKEGYSPSLKNPEEEFTFGPAYSFFTFYFKECLVTCMAI